MPELPEVETTCRGIAPHVTGQSIRRIIIREARMRWPVSPELKELTGLTILTVTRRAKYILITFDTGTLILHLGMSGSLRVIDPAVELRKHDHVLISLSNDLELRYHDPRRFGCLLWTEDDPNQHELIRNLGPEPLSEAFSAESLKTAAVGRKTSIKQFIMDGKIVVGVGNIYACEALYRAGIHPKRKASAVSLARLRVLTEEIKAVLKRSIKQGGTTLRDFLREDGTAGYFKQQLTVYDREGELCLSCESPIKRIVLGQRSTYFCPTCQK